MKAVTALTVVGIWLALNSSANAALTFELGGTLNGVTPTSSAPWLTAQFENVEGGVRLTLTSRLNVPSEFISAVAFNVNCPELTAAMITAGAGSDSSMIAKATDALVAFNPGSSATWIVAHDRVRLPGAGSVGRGFDILISWSSAQARRFNGTDVDTFSFTFAGLTEEDFNVANASGVLIAAHVQGIPLPGGGTTSGVITGGVITVPEPTTILAGALLLLPFGVSTIRSLRKRV